MTAPAAGAGLGSRPAPSAGWDDPRGMTPTTKPLGARWLAASGPILAMLLALALVAATGLSQRSALPEAVEPWVYGYFAGRYPLFAFALVYGVAHLVRVAAGPGPASIPRRLAFGLTGAVILLLAGLYPTFRASRVQPAWQLKSN